MSRPSWDMTWMKVAEAIADRSLCSGRRIGAVIVDAENRVVATGYNGQPRGYEVGNRECREWCPRMQPGTEKTVDYANCFSVHAETNAIAFADRRHMAGGTLYVTSATCWDCGKVVANSGLSRVVMNLYKADHHRNPRQTINFMTACGLEIVVKEPEA